MLAQVPAGWRWDRYNAPRMLGFVVGLMGVCVAPTVPVEDTAPRVEATPRGALDVRTPLVQAEAVARGLDVRVGERWHWWSIVIVEGPGDGAVEVTLRDADGRIHARTLTLAGDTTQQRSRELSSALALVVEQAPAGVEGSTPTPEHEPKQPPSPVTGWVGVGPRVGFNAVQRPFADVGLSMAGGVSLSSGHLQPIASVEWSRTTTDPVVVDAVRVGAGLLGGAYLAEGRWWVGGGGMVRAQWAQARAQERAAGWWPSPSAIMAVRYTAPMISVGLWLGADLVLPAMIARGDAGIVRWAAVRPAATLHLALPIPWGPTRPRQPKRRSSSPTLESRVVARSKPMSPYH